MRRPIPFLAAIALLASAGACARVPADVSDPDPEPRGRDPEPRANATPPGPVPDACVAAELDQCARACSDRECLAWCGGSACAATIASLHACMDETEQRFRAEHPSPTTEFHTVEVAGELIDAPTDESLDRQYEWSQAYDDAIHGRWADTCAGLCTAALDEAAEDEDRFCRDWQDSYHQWARLVAAPVEDHAAMLGMSADTGLLLLSMMGSHMSVTGQLGSRHDAHATAVQRLVSQASAGLTKAAACVPKLDSAGVDLTVAVRFDGDGAVVEAEAIDGPAAARVCVADEVAATLRLPARIAREHPELDLRVRIAPPVGIFGLDQGGLDGVFDSAWADSAFGDGLGDGFGDGFGVGGLGAGGGLGGGGTAEGLGDLGDLGGGVGTKGVDGGSLGPAPEPAPPEPAPNTSADPGPPARD